MKGRRKRGWKKGKKKKTSIRVRIMKKSKGFIFP